MDGCPDCGAEIAAEDSFCPDWGVVPNQIRRPATRSSERVGGGDSDGNSQHPFFDDESIFRDAFIGAILILLAT